MNDVLRDHDEFADAFYTLFDADVANGGTNGCSRDYVIYCIGEALAQNREARSVNLHTLARAMLATYEATLARIANREEAKS